MSSRIRRPCSPRTSCVWVARMTRRRQTRHYYEGFGEQLTDIGDSWSDTNFDPGVTLLSELALEEFVQLRVEDAICDELSLLGHSYVRCSSGHGCVVTRNSAGGGQFDLWMQRRRYQRAYLCGSLSRISGRGCMTLTPSVGPKKGRRRRPGLRTLGSYRTHENKSCIIK